MLIPWLIYFDKTFQHAVDPNPQTTNNNKYKNKLAPSCLSDPCGTLNRNPTHCLTDAIQRFAVVAMTTVNSHQFCWYSCKLQRSADQLFLTVRYAMWGHSCCAATAGHLVRWRPARDFSNRLITVSTASLLARSRLVFFYYLYTFCLGTFTCVCGVFYLVY